MKVLFALIGPNPPICNVANNRFFVIGVAADIDPMVIGSPLRILRLIIHKPALAPYFRQETPPPLLELTRRYSFALLYESAVAGVPYGVRGPFKFRSWGVSCESEDGTKHILEHVELDLGERAWQVDPLDAHENFNTWAIYESPRDFPGLFVMRRHTVVVGAGEGGIKADGLGIIATSVLEARLVIPVGSTKITMNIGQTRDPGIPVEEWI